MPSDRRHMLKLLLCAVAGAPNSGCAWMRQFFGPRDPYAGAPPCQLSQDATAPEVIAYLNANTEKIQSWRSTHVKISGRGAAETPVSISANLTIQAPRNFRLRANSFAGEEVDLGSNMEQFWFWNRRSEENYVFVAYHDESAVIRRPFPIPFQPDWIMEAFGVMPIDATSVTAEPGAPGSQTIRLHSTYLSPQGKPVKKITDVDTCRGEIRKHELRDEQGQVIASAVMDNYVRDPKTQAMLPTRILLDWPRANVGLTLWISEIVVNPRIPDQIWKRPTKAGYPVLEMNQVKNADALAEAIDPEDQPPAIR